MVADTFRLSNISVGNAMTSVNIPTYNENFDSDSNYDAITGISNTYSRKFETDLYFFSELSWERPWWPPIQCRNKGRAKEAKGYEEREIRSSLLILGLKKTSCKIQESKREARSSISCMF